MDWNIQTGARTLWQEARGEPLEGQKAVAHVLANRLHDGRWGKSLSEVCLSEYKGIHQFSGWNRNDSNRILASRLDDNLPILINLADLILDAVNGESDPTNGAMWYYADSIEPPTWAQGATFCGKFGSQLFYKNVK